MALAHFCYDVYNLGWIVFGTSKEAVYSNVYLQGQNPNH